MQLLTGSVATRHSPPVRACPWPSAQFRLGGSRRWLVPPDGLPAAEPHRRRRQIGPALSIEARDRPGECRKRRPQHRPDGGLAPVDVERRVQDHFERTGPPRDRCRGCHAMSATLEGCFWALAVAWRLDAGRCLELTSRDMARTDRPARSGPRVDDGRSCRGVENQ